MLKGLLAVIYKELLQVRRDPSTRIVFLVPVIQTIIFGFAIDMDVRHIATVVYDMSRTSESRRVVERLENTGTFRILGEARSEREARERIIAGEAKVAVIVPADYGAKLQRGEQATLQLLVDGSDSNVANNAVQTAAAIGQLESAARSGADVTSPLVDVRPRVLFNPDLVSSRFFVPGLAGIILQTVTMLLTTFAIVRERERGTLEQLLVTPVSRSALILGKTIPYVVVGLIQTVFVLLLLRYLFEVEVEGDVLLLMALSTLFLLPSLALGILVSTVAENQAEALQLGFLIIMPSVLLSGFAFPRETMPLPVYALSCALPVTYYVEILRGIILRGAGFSALWPQTLALAGFAVVLVTASALRFKKRIG